MNSSKMNSAKFADGELNYFVAKLTCGQLKANLI